MSDSSFDNSLLNCCALGSCSCVVAFVCCYDFSSAARTKYDNSNLCFNCCCMPHVAKRNVIREGYGIEGNCCGDIIISTCCKPCSGIQLMAEVQKRGPIRQSMTTPNVTVNVNVPKPSAPPLDTLEGV